MFCLNWSWKVPSDKVSIMIGDNSNQSMSLFIAAAVTGVCVLVGWNVFSFLSGSKDNKSNKKEEVFPVFKKTDRTSSSFKDGDNCDSIMRGYKKTADGHTTSYFTRELSDADKAILASTNQSPQRIDGASSAISANCSSTSQPSENSAVEGFVGSEWNFAKTFEEKDISFTSKQYLREKLKQVSIRDIKGYHVVVKDVKEVQGDVIRVFSRGKMKFIYDLSVDIIFAMNSVDAKRNTTGKCIITDIIADKVAEVQIQDIVGSDTHRNKGSALQTVIGEDLEGDNTFLAEVASVLRHFLLHLQETHKPA